MSVPMPETSTTVHRASLRVQGEYAEPPSPISVNTAGLQTLKNTGVGTPGTPQNGNNTYVRTEPEYPYWAVEDYVIKFLIEKAVAMREVPFMKATEALEFSANLAKVQSELMQLLPRDSMRSKKRQMQRPLPLD